MSNAADKVRLRREREDKQMAEARAELSRQSKSRKKKSSEPSFSELCEQKLLEEARAELSPRKQKPQTSEAQAQAQAQPMRGTSEQPGAGQRLMDMREERLMAQAKAEVAAQAKSRTKPVRCLCCLLAIQLHRVCTDDSGVTGRFEKIWTSSTKPRTTCTAGTLQSGGKKKIRLQQRKSSSS